MADRHLPLVNPPLNPPPPAGTRFRDNYDFVYDVAEVKNHVNRDGTASWLITLECTCADCGGTLLQKQGPKRGSLPRRCPEHAQGKGWSRVKPFGVAEDGAVRPGKGLRKAVYEALAEASRIVSRRLLKEMDRTDKASVEGRAARETAKVALAALRELAAAWYDAEENVEQDIMS